MMIVGTAISNIRVPQPLYLRSAFFHARTRNWRKNWPQNMLKWERSSRRRQQRSSALDYRTSKSVQLRSLRIWLWSRWIIKWKCQMRWKCCGGVEKLVEIRCCPMEFKCGLPSHTFLGTKPSKPKESQKSFPCSRIDSKMILKFLLHCELLLFF